MYSASCPSGLKVRSSTYRLNRTVWEGYPSTRSQGPEFIGPQGMTGHQGPQGPQGRFTGSAFKGFQGFQGIAGPTGYQGFQGGFSNTMTNNVYFGSTGMVIGSTLSAIQTFYADTIHGSSFSDTTDSKSAVLYCASSILPFRPNTYSLGSTLHRWSGLHIYGNTIYIGGYAISISSSSSSILNLQSPSGNSSQLVNTSNTNNRIDPSLIPFSAFKYGFTQGYRFDSPPSLLDFSNQLFSMITQLDPYYNGLVAPVFPSGSTLISVDTCIDTLNSSYYIIELRDIPSVQLRLPADVSFPILGGSTGTHFIFENTSFPYLEQTFVSGEIVLFGFARSLFGTEFIIRIDRVGCNIPDNSISSREVGSGAITFAKLQRSSVQTQNIQDFSVPFTALAFDVLPFFTSGVQGAQGPFGTQGQQGPSGPQGAASQLRGQQGSQGTKGINGFQGSIGLSGFIYAAVGLQGTQGYQGPQGIQGIGPTGAYGVIGPVSALIGVQGLRGLDGGLSSGAIYTGPAGPQGRLGAQGRQGTAGTTGISGYQGIQGTSTYTSGRQGQQSCQGFYGQQSASGTQAATGSIGFQGVQCASDIGMQGLQGNIGYVGTQGNAGYQGFQWMTSITGPTGYDGGDGCQGQQGDASVGAYIGYQGPDNSATGLQGMQGMQGEPFALFGCQGNIGGTGVQGVQGTQGLTNAVPACALTLACMNYIPPVNQYEQGFFVWNSMSNGFEGQTFNAWNVGLPGSSLICPYTGWYEILLWGNLLPAGLQTYVLFVQVNSNFIIRSPVLNVFLNQTSSEPVSAHFLCFIKQNDLISFGSYSSATTPMEFGISVTSPLYLCLKNLS